MADLFRAERRRRELDRFFALFQFQFFRFYRRVFLGFDKHLRHCEIFSQKIESLNLISKPFPKIYILYNFLPVFNRIILLFCYLLKNCHKKFSDGVFNIDTFLFRNTRINTG